MLFTQTKSFASTCTYLMEINILYYCMLQKTLPLFQLAGVPALPTLQHVLALRDNSKPILRKEGTEGTTPASGSKGIRTDYTADFPSQKAALPKFPSWSLPTSKSASGPCRNHLPLLQVATLQLVKYQLTPPNGSPSTTTKADSAASPLCAYTSMKRSI